MSVIVSISSFIIPGIMLFIVLYGIIKKQNVYDDFVTGATGGLKTVIKVMPTLIGLMVAVAVLRESGFMEVLGKLLGKVTNPIGFPGELMPRTRWTLAGAILTTISGTIASVMLANVI